MLEVRGVAKRFDPAMPLLDGIDLDVAQQELYPEDERRISIERGYIAGADVPAATFINIGILAALVAVVLVATGAI